MRLSTENLACVRGGRTIFSGLDFEVRGGECLLILGPNGAGKTSLLRLLAGYLQPATGTISIEGIGADGPQAEPQAEARPKTEEISVPEVCHFVGHLNGVKSHFTVHENLAFWARYLSDDGGNRSHDKSRESAIDRALDAFALSSLGGIPAGYLSAGQKRRLCLARLLVATRPIWLLDEPTASLDKQSQSLLADAVNAHVTAGGMAIAATHLELGIENTKELTLGRKGGEG